MASNVKEKGKILVVDDHEITVKLLEKILTRVYEIKTALSGEDALQLLTDGYKPNVIISDQIMPGMNGSEFLSKSKEICPLATRVILTGTDEPKEIISAINQAHAYMYLKKPWNNLELFQAAKIAYDHYIDSVKYRNKLDEARRQVDEYKQQLDEYSEKIEHIEELEEKVNDMTEELRMAKLQIDVQLDEINEQEQYIAKLDVFPNQIFRAMSELVREYEKFFYNDHTGSVTSITRAIAKDMGLSKDLQQKLIMSSLLHNMPLIAMPDYFHIIDPNYLDDVLRARYFNYFNRVMRILRRIDLAKDSVNNIAQIWEHYDGSGHPEGLLDEEIGIVGQIVALANIYHRRVYGLTAKDYEQILSTGTVSQSFDTTLIRHKDAVRYLYKHVRWFDYDVFHSFQTLAKHKECKALVPAKGTMTVTLKEYVTKYEITDGNTGYDDQTMSTEMDEHIRMVPKEIPIRRVKSGMEVVDDIVTVSGIMAFKQGTELNPADVKKLSQLSASHLINDKVTVLVPSEEEPDYLDDDFSDVLNGDDNSIEMNDQGE